MATLAMLLTEDTDALWVVFVLLSFTAFASGALVVLRLRQGAAESQREIDTLNQRLESLELQLTELQLTSN